MTGLPLPHLGGTTPVVAVLLILLLLLALARGAKLLLTLASWALLAGLVVVMTGQRAAFDPVLARIESYFRLDGQSVSGSEVRIRMAPDGHFWVRARLNGTEQRMLVDSGATITAISAATARAAGLQVGGGLFPVAIDTANGRVDAETAKVANFRFGTIVARDLPVVVSPAFGDMNVLGMNFLSRLKSWRVEDGVLIMTPHHPQDADEKSS